MIEREIFYFFFISGHRLLMLYLLIRENYSLKKWNHLRGKTLALIESFLVLDSNFNNAYSLLKTEFFDENFLLDTILDKILN